MAHATESHSRTTVRTPASTFGAKLTGTLIVLSFAVGLDVSSVASVNAALPDVGAALGIGESSLQWIVTGYAITFAGFLLLGGRLTDIFSRRAVFALGIGIFTAATLVAAVAGNLPVIVSARAVQGIGAAISGPAALALLFQLFPDGPLRRKALAIYSGVGSASFAAGLALGGVLTSGFDWRAVFVFNAVLGALVLLGTRLIPPSPRACASPSTCPASC
ncbi:MFS transporter [Streptomyces sp. NPDC001852]|uniref:MFS transporter n=1 Tax=Streptomyces sp. NPDC001852 TaxID=3364619 RepID=UPI0036B7DF00